MLFTPSYRGRRRLRRPSCSRSTSRGDVPDGVAVLDLLGRRVHGSGGVVLDSVREFCRKRGIRFEPGPWKLPGRPPLNGGIALHPW